MVLAALPDSGEGVAEELAAYGDVVAVPTVGEVGIAAEFADQGGARYI